MDIKDKTMWVSIVPSIFVAIIAIVGSLISNYYNNKLIHNSELNLKRFQLTTDTYREIMKLFYEWEDRIDELSIKYSIPPNEANKLYTKLTLEENLEVNSYRTKINIMLGQIFLLVDDKDYALFGKEFVLGKNSLKVLRESLLVAFRKINFPNTEFVKKEDIRLIFKE